LHYGERGERGGGPDSIACSPCHQRSSARECRQSLVRLCSPTCGPLVYTHAHPVERATRRVTAHGSDLTNQSAQVPIPTAVSASVLVCWCAACCTWQYAWRATTCQEYPSALEACCNCLRSRKLLTRRCTQPLPPGRCVHACVVLSSSAMLPPRAVTRSHVTRPLSGRGAAAHAE